LDVIVVDDIGHRHDLYSNATAVALPVTGPWRYCFCPWHYSFYPWQYRPPKEMNDGIT
jgi:hypothetical protein